MATSNANRHSPAKRVTRSITHRCIFLNRQHHRVRQPKTLCQQILKPEYECRESHQRLRENNSLVTNIPSRDLLVTAKIHVYNSIRQVRTCRILLDTCSNTNFMTGRLATHLNLSKPCWKDLIGFDRKNIQYF